MRNYTITAVNRLISLWIRGKATLIGSVQELYSITLIIDIHKCILTTLTASLPTYSVYYDITISTSHIVVHTLRWGFGCLNCCCHNMCDAIYCYNGIRPCFHTWAYCCYIPGYMLIDIIIPILSGPVHFMIGPFALSALLSGQTLCATYLHHIVYT